MDRQERIDEVLGKRLEAANQLVQVLQNARSVRESIVELAREAVIAASRGGDDTRLAAGHFQESAADIVSSLDAEIARCARLQARLSRPTLSVGAIGRARTGKSRYLQSLTGLSRQQIPDSDGGFCTGVTSVIRPGPAVAATVSFRTEAEFRSMLEPYYSELGMGPVPPVSSIVLPTAPSTDGDPQRAEKWRHLTGYIDALESHRHLLGAPPRSINPSELPLWVTQTDSNGAPLHAHRFVEKVDITAPFASAVSGISVVDLPGMGDTNLTDIPRMLAAVQDDVDVVILLRRPDPVGDDWMAPDIELYRRVSDALPGIPMSQRAFILLNKTRDPDNARQVEHFANTVTSRPMAVADVLIADASDAADVARTFDIVLDHLVSAAKSMDAELLDSVIQSLASVYDRVRSLVSAGHEITGTAADATPQAASRTVALTAQAREAMAVALETYLEQLRRARHDPDEPLGDAIRAVVAAARTDKGMPTAGAVDALIAVRGGLPIAYGQLLNEARAHLARHFVSLEGALETSVREMKERLALLLAKDARLAALATGSDAEWLMSLANELAVALGAKSTVRDALTILAGAKLTYRGFLQHRIRPLLDGLNPNNPLYPMEPGVPYSASDVRDMVEATYDNALGRVDKMLRDEFLSEPSQAVFALVEEFVDRILRSRGAESEWNTAYLQFKNRIWPEEWAILTSDMADVQRWRTAVAHFETDLREAQRALGLGEEPA